jgi:hypothetical protein
MTSKISTETGLEPVVVADAELEEVDEDVVGIRRDERGMVSAEWTVGIIAAIAIAGVLLAVVTTGSVKTALLNIILAIIKAFTKGL